MVDENDSLDETRDKEQIDKKYLAGSGSSGGSLEDAFGDFFSDVEKEVEVEKVEKPTSVTENDKSAKEVVVAESKAIQLPPREEGKPHVSSLVPVPTSKEFQLNKIAVEKVNIQVEFDKKIASYNKSIKNAQAVINDKQNAIKQLEQEREKLDDFVGDKAEEFNKAKRKHVIRKKIEVLKTEINDKKKKIYGISETISEEKKNLQDSLAQLFKKEKEIIKSHEPIMVKKNESEPGKIDDLPPEEPQAPAPEPIKPDDLPPARDFENEKRLLLRNIESHEYARGQTLVAIKKERDPHMRVLFEEDIVLIDKDIERYKNELAVIDAELRKIENKDIVETKVDDSKQKVNDSQTVEIKIQDPLILRKIESHEYARDQITRALKIEKNPKTIKLLQEKIRLIDVDLVKFRKALEEVSESDIENVVEEETELIKETPEVSEVASEPQTQEVLSDVDMSEEPSLATNTQSEVGPVSMHALKYIKKLSPEGKAFVAENMKQKFWNNTVDKIRFALSGTLFNWHEKKASQLNSERNRIGAKIKELEDKARLISGNLEGAQNRNIDPIQKRESRAERNKYDMELEIQKLSNEKHRIEGSLFQREMKKKNYLSHLNALSQKVTNRIGWLISPFKAKIEALDEPAGDIDLAKREHEKNIKIWEAKIEELKKKLTDKRFEKASGALKKEIAALEKSLEDAKKGIAAPNQQLNYMDSKIKKLKDRVGYWEKILEEFKKKVPEAKDYLNINNAA